MLLNGHNGYQPPAQRLAAWLVGYVPANVGRPAAAAKAPVCMVLSLDVLPAFADTIYALPGMSEPRGRLAQCSVSLREVLAASLGAHRKAQHARVCFARRPLL